MTHIKAVLNGRAGPASDPRRWGGALLLGAGAAVALAACSTTTTTSTARSTTSAAAATVKTATTSYGTILETPSGQVLYALTADTATHDACTGSCLAIWPPLTASATPVAGSGVSGSKLSTLKLSDGKRQVVYAGRPLYRFSGDSAAGQTKGQGLPFPAGSAHPKGHWWVVNAAGGYVTKAVSHSGGSGSGGYGY